MRTRAIPIRAAAALACLLAATGAWSGSAAAQSKGKDQKEQLEEAEKLLRGPKEPEVREGAKLCRSLNSEKAMDLVLDVLNVPTRLLPEPTPVPTPVVTPAPSGSAEPSGSAQPTESALPSGSNAATEAPSPTP